MNRHVVLVFAAIALVGATAGLADERPTVDCTIRLQLSHWSPGFDRVDGTGIVACADGTSMPVDVEARGLGLMSAKSSVTHGTGRFHSVHQISDVLGTYSEGFVRFRTENPESPRSLSNGKVWLELAGTEEGHELGRSIAGFAIRSQ